MSMYERNSDFPIRVSAESEFDHVVSTQSEAFDDLDVVDVACDNAAELLALLNIGDAEAIGKLFIKAKAELVFSRAQHQHYGRIVFTNKTANEVKA
jgi:hypothetical protein